MDKIQFEALLQKATEQLTGEVKENDKYHKPSAFEQRVRIVMAELLVGTGYEAEPDIDQGFPDIVVGNFGAEVKATESNSWRCIANSVSEGQRAKDVDHIYVLYGKFGGDPEVRWADYGNSIMHVRTSHVPRFEIEIGTDKPLFTQLGTTYEEFRSLQMNEKMPLIRHYARSRLKKGEQLWWLENSDVENQSHSLSLGVRAYIGLTKTERWQCRAEASIMCPQVVGKSSLRYVDAALFLMTYRGVLCTQARDLWTAGSVGERGPTDSFLINGLIDIQNEMREAAKNLENALFLEYWDVIPEKENRMLEWLKRADKFAVDWKPSEYLFLEEQGKA